MKIGSKLTAFILLFVGLVLVTYIGMQFPARIDMTSEHVYTLSPGTRTLLGKVEDTLTIQFVFTRSSEQIPIDYKNFASRIETMLRQFAAASHGKIKLKVIDPRPDTDEDTAVRRSGLTPRNLPNGDTIFFGLIATQADQERTIPWFDPNRESFVEYDVAKLVYAVQQVEKPRLGLVSSLPLRSEGNPMMGQPGQNQIVVQEWENAFEVVPIEASADSVPDKIDVLAVVHPQNVSEKLQFSIDQFLLAGKPVFIAVDPSSYVQQSQQQQQQNPMMFNPQQQNVSSDLPRLFNAWGITYDAANVVGDLDLATAIRTGQGILNYPLFITTKPEQLSRTSTATSALKKMLFIQPGSVQVAADRGYEVTPLATTTTRTGEVPAMMVAFTAPNEITRQIKDGGVKKNIAVLVHGTFKSAFPDGLPKEPEKTPDTPETPAAADAAKPAEPAAATPAALKESAKPGTLVVVADSDWMLDNFSLDQRFAGTGYAVPSNDNLAFATNTLELLDGSSDLISIRSKGPSTRNFELIHKMEISAQEKYQAEAQELEKRLRDVQTEISKLMTGETEGKRLIATPEVSAAVAKYRDQEAEVRTKLREIRRKLREDIESLQTRLAVMNLFVVPCFVLACGLFFLVRRNNRQRAA